MEASSHGSLTGCDGCAGDWCSRHAMPKGDSHKRLCATNKRYFDFWENGKRHTAERSESSESSSLLKRQREHWLKLHTTLMDSATFAEWVDAIPGCATCKRDFMELLKINPPRYDDWFRWTWEAHNAVNLKLGKPEFTFEQAANKWNWNHE